MIYDLEQLCVGAVRKVVEDNKFNKQVLTSVHAPYSIVQNTAQSNGLRTTVCINIHIPKGKQNRETLEQAMTTVLKQIPEMVSEVRKKNIYHNHRFEMVNTYNDELYMYKTLNIIFDLIDLEREL